MEARILPDGSVLSREWSPELAAALDAWEAVITTAPAILVGWSDAARNDYLAREEAARIAFVVLLARELLGIRGGEID